MRLLSLSPLPVEALRPNLPDDFEVVVLEPRTTEAAAAAVRGADLVLGDFSGEVEVTAGVVAAMDRVRLFHQPTTGYDRVDGEALAARGIPLTNAGAVTSVAMAEHVVMAALALLKSLVWCDAAVRRGEWPQHEVVSRSLVDLRGKTVGLIGLGSAAQEAARRFAAFGVTLLYTARSPRPEESEADLGVAWRELDDLLAESDVVCVLVDLNPGTRRLIGERELGLMKPSAFLVNAARGEILDEAALAGALAGGRLAGAALDTFTEEPLPEASPLRAFDNVILTPHVGGATLETRLGMLTRSFDVLRRAAAGELPEGVVNGVAELRQVG